MNVKAVWFDLDDTLLWDERSVEESFQAVCQEAAAQYSQIDPIALEQAVRTEARALYESFATFPFTQQIGINPFEALWANFNDEDNENFRHLKQLVPQYRTEAWSRGLKKLGIEDSELGQQLGEKFAAERRLRPIVYEETFEILDALKGKVQLLLLTNGSPELQQEKLASVPKLAPYFDHIVISGGFGKGKPAVEIFEHSMGLLGIQAEDGIMVGDKLTTDIKGALSVGMKAVWINRREMSRSEEIVPDYEIHNLRELLPILKQ